MPLKIQNEKETHTVCGETSLFKCKMCNCFRVSTILYPFPAKYQEATTNVWSH